MSNSRNRRLRLPVKYYDELFKKNRLAGYRGLPADGNIDGSLLALPAAGMDRPLAAFRRTATGPEFSVDRYHVACLACNNQGDDET